MFQTIKSFLVFFIFLTSCIDEQYQNISKDEVDDEKKEVVDENVRALNAELAKKETNTNPEYSMEEVLFEAVQKGDLEKVRAIFGGGFVSDLNLRNPNDKQDEKTLLMEAAAWGRIAIVEYLLSLGADVDQTDLGGKTASDWAKEVSNILIMELLSGKSLSPDLMMEKLFEMCAVGGHAEEISFILSRNVDPNFARENDNVSPLFEAARAGKIDSMKALLENGASVNFHRKGHTGLIGAITSKNPAIVEYILQNGADPTIPFERGARKASPKEYAQNTLRSQPEIFASIVALLDAALAEN